MVKLGLGLDLINTKVSTMIVPEIKLFQAFTADLVTSNFDDDSIKNEQASTGTPFSHYKSMNHFLDAQRHPNSSELTWQK